MSSIIMHLYISQIVQKELNLSNKFLAGAVLPDMIKIKTKNRKESHYIKEFKCDDKIKALPDLDRFLFENKDKLNDEITLGYYAHLIEDKIWFNTYIDSFAKCIDKQNILYISDNTIHKTEEFTKDIYSDYGSVDGYIIETNNIDIDKLRDELKEELKDYNINNIIDDNVVIPIKYKDTIVKFISLNCLNSYIDEAVKQVKEEIMRVLGE